MHCSEAGDAVPRVEHVCHIDEEKSPLLLIIPIVKEGTGSVDGTLNPVLEIGTELLVPAHVLCPSAGYLEHAFCK